MHTLVSFLKPHLQAVAWLIALATLSVAVLVWGQTIAWNSANLSIYTFFPLLGLIAFGLMWAQYMADTIGKLVGGEAPELTRFYKLSSSLVLAAILLHPALLVWQLWRDDAGLPPGSYLSYVAPSLKWAVLLGNISLFIFLAFELRRRFHNRPWWRFVLYANDAAVAAVYIHAYNLGTHTHLSWFKTVWIFYGVTLAAVLLHKYIGMLRRRFSPSAGQQA